MTPNLRRWLAELDRATALHWRPAAGHAPQDGPVILDLLRDGVPRLTLGFGRSVWIETAGAAAPKAAGAALPPASLEALKNALDEATR